MGYHQRRPKRLKGYDYCSMGVYFVTIRTNYTKNVFGQIENNRMILNDFGQIAHDEWIVTPQIRTNVQLDTFIIMPDHIHGIIKILPAVGATGPVAHYHNKGNINTKNTQYFNKHHDPSSHKKFYLNTKKALQPNSLGSIIGQYKSVVTKKIRKKELMEFHWQRNYYDRIIRSKPELIAIRKYIMENPINYQF